MYLVVFGADYCPYTQAMWMKLLSLNGPFVYVPYSSDKTKVEFWKPVREALDLTENDQMTFPTLVAIDDRGQVRQLTDLPEAASLTAPSMRGLRVIRERTDAREAFQGRDAFVFREE